MKSTVSERGQITIPKRLREQLGIAPGQVLDFAIEEGRLTATKIVQDDPVGALYGLLGRPGSSDEVLSELRGEPDTV